jgi:hypothetical protein
MKESPISILVLAARVANIALLRLHARLLSAFPRPNASSALSIATTRSNKRFQLV